MDPKTVPPNPAGETKKLSQEDIEKKLQEKALKILKNNGISLSEGRKERLNKVIRIVTVRVANNSLSPKGKEGLPKLLQGFLEHRIKVYKGEAEEVDSNKKLDDLIDDLCLELGNFKLIQQIGHGIADVFITTR